MARSPAAIRCDPLDSAVGSTMARLTPGTQQDRDTAVTAAVAAAGRLDPEFRARFDDVFPVLHGLFLQLYGEREDGREALAEVIARGFTPKPSVQTD